MEFKKHYRSLSAIIGKAHIFKLTNQHVWSADEDNIIRQYYPTEGSACYNRLINRNKQSVLAHAHLLGIQYTKPTVWTDDLLKKLKTLTYIDEEILLNQFDNMSSSIFWHKVKELNLQIANHFKSRDWTKDEDLILIKYYPTEGSTVYKRLINREMSSCDSRARALKIKRLPSKFVNWTADEDNILKQFYPIEGRNVYKRLIGRDMDSCSNRAHTLGIYSNCLQDMSFCMKKIKCIETGEVFNSLTEANKKYHCNVTAYMLRQKKNYNENRTAGGYHWEYINEEGKKSK